MQECDLALILGQLLKEHNLADLQIRFLVEGNKSARLEFIHSALHELIHFRLLGRKDKQRVLFRPKKNGLDSGSREMIGIIDDQRWDLQIKDEVDVRRIQCGLVNELVGYCGFDDLVVSSDLLDVRLLFERPASPRVRLLTEQMSVEIRERSPYFAAWAAFQALDVDPAGLQPGALMAKTGIPDYLWRPVLEGRAQGEWWLGDGE